MRVLIGIFGAFVGIIVGCAAGLLIAVKAMGGDDFGGAMLCIITIPIGLLAGTVLGVVLALRTQHYLQREDLGADTRRKKTLLRLGLVIGIPSLVVGMFWGVNSASGPPSDQQLLANFSKHRAEFDYLVVMVRADKGLTRVDSDWTQPNDPQTIGFSPARIAEYRNLLSRVGTPRGFQTWGIDGDIEFYYWLTGSAISSEEDKGYCYLTQAPLKTLKSLDQCQKNGQKAIRAYRHIQGRWYLFYEYAPD